jgi:hypothetical protein
MSKLRVQCVLPAQTAIPEDAFSNTFHFDIDGGLTEAALDVVQAGLETFYGDIGPTILDGTQLGTDVEMKFYNLEDPTPRPPIREDSFAHGAAGAEGYPAEVAICLSYQGARVAGEPQARRRGRIYLGPVTIATGDVVNGAVRVRAADRTVIADAAAALAGSSIGGVGIRWAVYSPTTDISETIDAAFHDITDGWVDDAFDTVRSRGADSTTRTLWSA